MRKRMFLGTEGMRAVVLETNEEQGYLNLEVYDGSALINFYMSRRDTTDLQVLKDLQSVLYTAISLGQEMFEDDETDE